MHEGLSRAGKQESKGRKNKQQTSEMAEHKRGRWVKSSNIQVSGAPREEKKGNSGAEPIFRSMGRSRKR